MTNIAAKVRSIIAEHLGVDLGEVTDDAHILDDLGADSLDTIELVMALEEGFGIAIDDQEAEAIGTVGDAVRLVSGLVAKRDKADA